VSVAFADDARLVSGGDDSVRITDWRRGVTLLTVPHRAFQVDADGAAPDVVFYGMDNVVRVAGCDVCGPVESVQRLAEERTTRDLTETERVDFHVES
jgi:hypothetical protein